MKKFGKWILFSTLYLTQYAGIGFIAITLIAILRKNGASLSTLGNFSALIAPYALKFLWSPIIDKYGSKKIGHYKIWLLIAQLLMAFSLFSISFISPSENLTFLFFVLFIYVLACSTQDLSLDALACRVFEKEERQKINAIQVAAGMVGSLIGGGLMPILYPKIHWDGMVLSLTVITLIGFVLVFFYREPQHKVYNNQKMTNPFTRLFTFWKDKINWLLMLLMYAVGFNIVFVLLTPFLVDNGWNIPKIGYITKIFGSLIGLISALITPIIIKKLGRFKAIGSYLIFQGFALWFMLFVIYSKATDVSVYLFISLYYFSFSGVMTSITTKMMDYASISETPSTDYTIQNSTFLLFSYIFMPISLNLSEHINLWYIVIVGGIVAITSGIITIKKTKRVLDYFIK